MANLISGFRRLLLLLPLFAWLGLLGFQTVNYKYKNAYSDAQAKTEWLTQYFLTVQSCFNAHHLVSDYKFNNLTFRPHHKLSMLNNQAGFLESKGLVLDLYNHRDAQYVGHTKFYGFPLHKLSLMHLFPLDKTPDLLPQYLLIDVVAPIGALKNNIQKITHQHIGVYNDERAYWLDSPVTFQGSVVYPDAGLVPINATIVRYICSTGEDRD